jgi:hypothetical protein
VSAQQHAGRRLPGRKRNRDGLTRAGRDPDGSVPIPVAFYLVAPPKPGDLAGLVILATFLGQTSQLGSPGDITVRSSGDPRGVGLNISFRWDQTPKSVVQHRQQYASAVRPRPRVDVSLRGREVGGWP